MPFKLFDKNQIVATITSAECLVNFRNSPTRMPSYRKPEFSPRSPSLNDHPLLAAFEQRYPNVDQTHKGTVDHVNFKTIQEHVDFMPNHVGVLLFMTQFADRTRLKSNTGITIREANAWYRRRTNCDAAQSSRLDPVYDSIQFDTDPQQEGSRASFYFVPGIKTRPVTVIPQQDSWAG